MTKAKQSRLLIATQDTFTKEGRFVPRGNPVPADEVDYDPDTSTNLIEAPRAAQEGVAVEVSSISPTGPNPTEPQQIAPDVVQTNAGYFQNGVRLVGEVTVPEKQRIEVVGLDDSGDAQAEVNQALEESDQRRAEQEAEARRNAAAADEADRRAAAEDDRPRRAAASKQSGKSKS